MIKLKSDYQDLEKLKGFLNEKTGLECSVEIDQWTGDMVINPNNKCVLVKKSGLIGAKVAIDSEGVAKVGRAYPGTFFKNLGYRGLPAIVLNLVSASGQNELCDNVDSYLKEVKEA